MAGTTERVLQAARAAPVAARLVRRRAGRARWASPRAASAATSSGCAPWATRSTPRPGAGGGYQLGAGRALPPLLLDDEEAVAIAVSLRLAAGGTVAGASEAAVRTLAKLDQVMPPRLRGEVQAIQGATETLVGAGVEVDGETAARPGPGLPRHGPACASPTAARDGAVTERRVEPVRLVATSRRWYLMAWDLDRDDWRTFRLDRMTSWRSTTWRFAPREHPDPVGLRAAVGGGRAVPLTSRGCGCPRRSRRWPSGSLPQMGSLEPDGPDACLLTAGGDDLLGMVFFLALPRLRARRARTARAARGLRHHGGAAAGGCPPRPADWDPPRNLAPWDSWSSCSCWRSRRVAVVAVVKANQRKALERKEAELAPVRQLAFEDVTALGEELQLLDLEVAGHAARRRASNADYQRALDAYEAAKKAADEITEPEHVKHVTEILEDARYAMACVRARVAGEPLPTRRPPCFFDPRHGLSTEDVAYAPPGGAARDVPACALDAERVQAGAEPDIRKVMVGNRRVPYFQGGRAYQPYAVGYFGGFGPMDWMFMGLLFGGGFDGLGDGHRRHR